EISIRRRAPDRSGVDAGPRMPVRFRLAPPIMGRSSKGRTRSRQNDPRSSTCWCAQLGGIQGPGERENSPGPAMSGHVGPPVEYSSGLMHTLTNDGGGTQTWESGRRWREPADTPAV